MEKEFLRYIFSTLAPILVIGGGWLVLKQVKKWEKRKQEKQDGENNRQTGE